MQRRALISSEKENCRTYIDSYERGAFMSRALATTIFQLEGPTTCLYLVRVALCFSHNDPQAQPTRLSPAAAFVTITPSKGPEQKHLVRDPRQGRGSTQETRLGDRLSWPIHFTSPAHHEHDSARLEQINGMGVFADRIYASTIHKSCSPSRAVSALYEEHPID